VLMRLRCKLTYANVVASLALLLALAGGTAYAATEMLPKNSVGTKQLRNGAVTKAKIAPGVLGLGAGAAGPGGPQRPTGATGPAGATGPSGASGPQGADGTPGAEGNPGVPGTPGTPGTPGAPGAPGAAGTIAGPLPSGESEQGQFVAYADPGTPPVTALTEVGVIDFPIPLAADPIAIYVAFGTPPSTECSGPANEPAAAPGYLCVYELGSINSKFTGFSTLLTEAQASRFGTSVAFKFENTVPGQKLDAGGTWAVTAP
jgi:hypothetical protein